jgi:hypothetical protein
MCTGTWNAYNDGSFNSGFFCDPIVVEIRLVDNNLRHQLSTQLGLLSNLIYLDLSRNQLSGLVPTGSELGRLTSLERFYLGKSATISSPELDIVRICLTLIYLFYGFVDGNQELSGLKREVSSRLVNSPNSLGMTTSPGEFCELTSLQELSLQEFCLCKSATIFSSELKARQFTQFARDDLIPWRILCIDEPPRILSL